jgi:GT2 family glycosyltransferase
VAAASGTWVAFQDSDDEWLPRKLECQMARLTAPGADYVAAYCGMMVVGRPERIEGERLVLRYIPKPSYRHVEGDILPTLLTASLVSTQTLVVRRDVLLDVGGFDEAMPALIDAECVLRLAQRGRFAFVDSPLVLQFFSPNSITLDRRRRLEAQTRIMEKHAALFDRNPRAKAARWYDIAGAHRHFGEIGAARAAMARARAAQPTKPMLWAMSAWLVLKGLVSGG